MTVSPNGQTSLANTVAAYSASGAPTGLSPVATAQVIGNDGSGNVAVTTIAGGTGAQIAQSGASIVISAPTGATSWVATPYNYSASPTFTIPSTQTVSNLTSGLQFNPANATIFNGYTQTISSVSSNNNVVYNVNFATDLRLNNAPLTILFAVYASTGVTPSTGSLPAFTYCYALPTASSSTGTYLQYSVRIKSPFTAPSVSYTLTMVPYIYVPSGSSLAGTNIVGGSSSSTSFYTTESNDYSVIVPSSSEYLETDSVALTSSGSILAISQGSVSTSSTQLMSGSLIAFGEPSVTTFKCSIPVFFSNFGTATSLTLYAAIYVGSSAYFTYNVTYNVSGLPYLFDTFEFQTLLTSIPFGVQSSLYVSYQTNNSTAITAYLSTAGLSSSQAPPATAIYTSKLTQYSSSSGNLAFANQETIGQYTSTAVSLSTTVVNLLYFPPSAGSTVIFSTANIVDSIQLSDTYLQSNVDVTFNFVYTTNAYSTAPSSDLPVIMVVLATTLNNGSIVMQPFAKAHKTLPNTVASNTCIDTVSCLGRINVLEQATTITAYAFVCANNNTANINVTSFSSVVTSGGVAFSGAGCSWTVNSQSLLGAGGGSGTGISAITTQSGSYLTSTTTNGAAVLNSTQASTTQAGLLAMTSALTANTVFRVLNSGAISATPFPYFSEFGSSIRIQYNGANVGQVVGTQLGAAIYDGSGAYVPTGATGLASAVYRVLVTMDVNITTEGTSTGKATLIGMPVIPAAGVFSTPFYWPVQVISGVTIPAGSLLYCSYVSGSTTLSLWYYTINSESYTACTNTNFTQPIQLRIVDMPVYTSTAPTN